MTRRRRYADPLAVYVYAAAARALVTIDTPDGPAPARLVGIATRSRRAKVLTAGRHLTLPLHAVHLTNQEQTR